MFEIANEDVETTIQRALVERVECLIYYTDETGQWLWAVQIKGTDFWLNSFNTRQEAEEYCNSNELPFEVLSI